jgi:hypothetical protein
MMIRRCVVVALLATFLLSACGGGDSSSQVAAFCAQAKDFRAKYGSDFDPTDKQKVAQAKVALQAMVNDAPKSIRAAVTSVNDAFDFLADGKVPPAYRNEEIRTASADLNKYGEKHCGLKPATATTPST